MLLNNLLKYKPTLFFLLLIGPLAYAQGVPQAGITSTPTDSDGSVSICFNGAISFTGFGGSLHFTPRSYSFFVIRSGQVTPVLLRERNILPRYSFLFTYGSLTKYDSSYYLFLSQELQLGEFSLGISQQASKVKSINLNNIGLSVGLSLENFDFGVLYNVGIRNVTQVFAPSVFKLYLTFDFSKYRRNNRGLFKRLQIDNYF